MTQPLDDQHPIVREAAIQELEDSRIMETAEKLFGPIMASYGITDVHRMDAIAEVVNRTARAILLRARRSRGILDEDLLTVYVLEALLLGVRLARNCVRKVVSVRRHGRPYGGPTRLLRTPGRHLPVSTNGDIDLFCRSRIDQPRSVRHRNTKPSPEQGNTEALPYGDGTLARDRPLLSRPYDAELEYVPKILGATPVCEFQVLVGA
jgi:hypothetical protein